MRTSLLVSSLFSIALTLQNVFWLPASALAQNTTSAQPKFALPIRFIDSATGYAIQPESVTVRAHRPGALEERLAPWQVQKSGHGMVVLERGPNTIAVASPGYSPMSGEFEMTEANPYVVQFLLEPLVAPPEVNPEHIGSLHRQDAMVILGYVGDDETGGPLSGVRVSSAPSGTETATDARGFFQIYIPVQTDAEGETAPASLVFEKSGYQTHEKQNLELWPNGDWTYRIRLTPGKGKHAVDERQLRRRAPRESAPFAAQLAPATIVLAGVADLVQPVDIKPLSTADSNSTVRIPRNIRVLKQDGVTIDYVTMDYYCKHVLPAEWINSWGSKPGGSNSLSAGAVALRCYAINYINHPRSITYDICGTSSCQNYGSATYTASDAAVNDTTDYVLVNASGVIPSTEYSAENNSITNGCGDAFTQPNGGCLFDPACTGQARYGHGRGMCQWGSARWATGYKMAGRNSNDSTPNGYPLQDWAWIVRHYYPTLALVKGAALVIGDDVKAAYDTTINMNLCAGGGITNGINCPLLANLPVGSVGMIVDGPQRITVDGRGHTWYKVQWNDAANTLGWSKENYLEHVFSTPGAPGALTAAAVSTNQINLTWSGSTSVAAGFELERANASMGPWVQLGKVAASVTSYPDRTLFPGSTWYYRLRAFNAGGTSAYSAVASATTANTPPLLQAISSKTVIEGGLLTFTNTATAPDFAQLLTDFESFTAETTNGLPLFRNPRYSSTTTIYLGMPGTNLLSVTPDLATVTGTYPTTGHGTGQVLRVSCEFTNPSSPWLRLTTANAPTWPNPVIDFTKKLRFDIWVDKPVKLAVGCRETVTAAGAPMGWNGGQSGAIEWAGVTNISGGAPMPSRVIGANTWTTLTFDFPAEPVQNFSGGNGVLSTATGLGVLEHLAVVPAGGNGVYTLYLDNFAVLLPRTLTYSLGAGAPAGASLNAATGVFTWTPTEAQGPGSYPISVIVSDNSSPSRSATNTFMVTVNETNTPPVLAAISDRSVYAGSAVAFTNSASDADFPANLLFYSLEPSAPADAAINSTNGVFTWTTADAQTNTTHPITVRVADNGSPPMSDARTFSITVLPKPTLQTASISGTNVILSWSAISNATFRIQYKNSLSDPTWQTLGPDITATNSPASCIDSTFGTVSQRFYRMQVVN